MAGYGVRRLTSLAAGLILVISFGTASAYTDNGPPGDITVSPPISVTFDYLEPIYDFAIVAPAPRIAVDREQLAAQPDDKTFAKINRLALRTSHAWEMPTRNGVWRSSLHAT